MKQIITILILTLFAGCAGNFSHTLSFNPHTPLRVAVLPFVQVDEKGEMTSDEGRLFVDNISAISGGSQTTPAQLLRKIVLVNLSKTAFDLVSPTLIDIDLPHHGFAIEEGKVDLKKLYDTSPIDICRRFLNCDAVFYGRVKRWDRSYYGIETVATVSFSLELIRASDGARIFSSEAEDAAHRGISKGPTSISSLVIEPIKGLDNEIVQDLAREMVTTALLPLVNQTADPKTEPPSIYAASHDAKLLPLPDGAPLIVLLFGTPGAHASFSIGGSASFIPMVERSPGHYYGEYVRKENEDLKGKKVEVFLADGYGRMTRQGV